MIFQHVPLSQVETSLLYFSARHMKRKGKYFVPCIFPKLSLLDCVGGDHKRTSKWAFCNLKRKKKLIFLIFSVLNIFRSFGTVCQRTGLGRGKKNKKSTSLWVCSMDIQELAWVVSYESGSILGIEFWFFLIAKWFFGFKPCKEDVFARCLEDLVKGKA